jgi:hypothetical protein
MEARGGSIETKMIRPGNQDGFTSSRRSETGKGRTELNAEIFLIPSS